MATKQSGSQWVASIGLVAALVCSPLTLSRPLAVQGQFEAPAGVEGSQGFGDWSAFRVSLELRSANDYARASKVVSRWLGEPPKTDARYPLRLRALVTGAEQERLTRMSIRPALADELNALLEGHAKDAGDTVKALKPVVAQLNAGAVERISERLSAADAEARLRSVLIGLSVAEANGLNALTSLDDDGDGLTNTQESWWCTNPLNANSDGDGVSDFGEVQQAKEWVGNLRAGPSAAGRPFLNWPMQDNGGNNPNCPDGDRDGVPDLAEEWELGLNPNKESTDGDKYDDGQELFGITLTDWGGLPRPEDPIGASMPGWVLSPGNHPFSAAFPAVIVQLSGAPINVQLVSTITSGGTIGNGTQRSYVVSDMDGSSDSKAKTKSLTDWQESSESVSEPARPLTLVTTDRLGSLGENPCVPIAVPVPTPSPNANGLTGGSPPCTGIRLDYMTIPDECRELTSSWENKLSVDIGWDLGPKLTFGGSHIFESGSEKPNSVWSDFWCKQAMVRLNLDTDNNAANTKQGVGQYQLGATQPQVARGFSGIQYSSGQDGNLVAAKLDQIAFALNQPMKTNTKTKGHSETNSETNTHTTSQEHTISNGNVWLSNDEWMTATAADTSHVADLTFNYVVRNSGSDLASRLDLLVFNVYLGSEAFPVCTYFVGADDCGTPPAPGGVLSVLFPGQNASFTSHRIPLAFDQLRSLDTGSKLVIRVEMVGMASSDQAFFENAVAGGVMVSIEDGPADNDDTVDTFLIPTWGDGDTMQDVMGRHFPSQQDENGNDSAIWTPENTSGSTPSWCVEPKHFGVSPQVWCKHALSTSDWWNIYLNNLGGGTSELNQTLVAPNSTAFFRFNKDTDLDGYSDRTESALSTDPFDLASHPKPELLAGVHQKPAVNSVVTATASLLNTGLYDAYGAELIMIAPDDSVTILNNTVGGSGRVNAGKSVVVGSSTKLSPLPTVWAGGSHAKPSAGGYYTGSSDRIYTFLAACVNPGGCDVGVISNTLALNWNDGLGMTGTLSLGAGYASPTPLNVGAYGVQVSMLSGKIMNGEAFSMTAYTPRDTFSYRINRVPYTEPLVIVSYNDPQGNHRFVIPSSAMSLTTPTQNLAAYAGQMLQDPGVEIATTAAFTPTAAQSVTVVVNNPTGVSLVNAHLFLEFVNISGTVAAGFPMTLSLPPGPSSLSMNWNTDAFSPTFQAGEDYIAMVFLTDYQGNILDTGGRPLSSWQVDLKADFAMAPADTDWDFGSASQGTLMKRSFTFANVGLQDILTYIQGVPGLSLSQTGSRRVGAADQTTYEIALNTIGLPVGVYDQSIVIRSSDPARPMQTVRVHGTVTAGLADVPASGLVRPLDVSVPVVNGSIGTWVTFNHNLDQPFPANLHPVRILNSTMTATLGVGRYATEFGNDVANPDIFGDGRDGVMPATGTIDWPNGAGYGTADGAAGSYYLTTSDLYAVWNIGPGDVVLIHQTIGANAGSWELNRAVSDIAGAGTYLMQTPLKTTYSSQGANRAQLIRVPQYRSCDVTGTVSPLFSWDGQKGGILAVLCRDGMTVAGSVSVTGLGFRGASAPPPSNRSSGRHGESYLGSYNVLATYPWPTNYTGGGGAYNNSADAGSGGGGGGYSSGGGSGVIGHPTNGSTGGGGGSTVGTSNLRVASYFGGGGGSGGNSYTSPPDSGGAGGAGGGMILLSAATLTVTGQVLANGANGVRSTGHAVGSGGAGAGGSILVRSRLADLGQTRVLAVGGAGGSGGSFSINGGNGGSGRVFAQYCDSVNGVSAPVAVAEKLDCHAVEQIEVSPYTQGQLDVPLSGNYNYRIQYGWRGLFASANYTVATLRVPAGMVSTVQFDVLASQMGATGNTSIDIANSPGVECSGAVANNGSLTCNSAALRDAFIAYWRSQNSPTTGTLNIPITVSLDRAGQILLTNLQIQTTGSKVRYLQLQAQTYSNVSLRHSLGQAAGLSIDVGDDGQIDVPANAPAGESGVDLTTAVNAYLSTRSGVVSVPLRVYLSPFASYDVVSMSVAPTLRPDASIALADVSFSDAAPTESNTISVTAVLLNNTGRETGGLVASAIAILSGTTPGAYYIGSAFVPNIPASGTATTEIAWNTLGITGNVPVRIVLDPFNRVTETVESNNVATRTLTIVARPDLEVTQADSGGVDEIAAGETLSLTARVANRGQRAAFTQTVAVYDGNPAQAGVLLGTMLAPPINGSGTSDLVFAWQPTVVGEHKLFFRADKDNAVNEYDEGNNDLVRTLFVGVAGGYDVDSGLAASDTPYSSTLGYGAIDTGQTDALNNCGGLPDDTYRRDPDGTVTYQFDRLLRNRFYHLDVVLRDCATGANRIESVEVNGISLATGIDLNDSKAHYLSFLLDPKVYDGRTITVKIKAAGSQAAIVSRVTVREVLYRYVDAGSAVAADSSWSGSRGYGWLDSYNASTGCGAYPYQTARVNQSGNTLQYRFDGLDPAKHYKVALSLYQCTGSGVVQRLDIDGNIVGADFAAQNASLMSVSRNVPQTLYAADGSIVVTVIRKDSSVNAMIGEIILEEVTASGSPVCDGLVNPTPTYLDVKGSVFINGQPAPVGTLVTAENPQGDTVGCFYVTLSGDYGYMRVFGADDLATPPMPGMHANDPVRFRVDGVVAVGSPLLLWQADLGRYVVDLNAGATQAQSILMAPGWNFISLRVEPPVPLIQNVLETISGKYCRVLALTATSNCAISEVFRLLKQMHSGVGYYTHITSTTTANAVIEGLTQPVDKPVPLQPGWNWIGYYPPAPMPITFALQTVLTHVVQVNDLGTSFVPDDLSHSLLREMGPGKGYRVFITGTLPVTLTYPTATFLLPGVAYEKPAEVLGLVCGNVAPTPGVMFIYGRLGESPGMPAGTRVEVLTPEGRVAGCATTGMAGEYGAVAAFGADGDTPGFHHGDAILLRINGKALRNTGLVWINDARIHRADVPGEYGLYLPSIQSAQP